MAKNWRLAAYILITAATLAWITSFALKQNADPDIEQAGYTLAIIAATLQTIGVACFGIYSWKRKDSRDR